MSDIYSRVEKYIRDQDLIRNGDSVLAAVSGGADSMCMLSLLIRYAGHHKIKLGVVTVDHGFRPEARKEAEYVGDFCREQGIFFRMRIIKPGDCEPTEEAARIARYRLIDEVAASEGFNKVALAHNSLDKAETFIFNLIRGTGVKGLRSIRPQRDMYIRPVLCLSREEIEEYLSGEKIKYYTDRTNLEDDYARNRIRHRILPVAAGINDRAAEHICAAADFIDLTYDYIGGKAREAAKKCVLWGTADTGKGSEVPEVGLRCDSARIRISEYRSLHIVIRMEILREILSGMTPHLKDITSSHLSDLDALTDRQNGTRLDLPYGIRAYKEYEFIHISLGVEEDDSGLDGMSLNVRIIPAKELFTEIEAEQSLDRSSSLGADTGQLCGRGDSSEIDTGPAYAGTGIGRTDQGCDEASDRSFSRGQIIRERTNKYTKYFDYDKINRQPIIRYASAGDWMTIDTSGHTKQLSRLMIDMKIPGRERSRIPLVAVGNEILWIVGYRDSCAYRIDEGTERVVELSVTGRIKDEA